MGRLAAVSWLLAVGVSYLAAGGYLGRLVEGHDREAMSRLPLLATALGCS
jgi:hypothetical protein